MNLTIFWGMTSDADTECALCRGELAEGAPVLYSREDPDGSCLCTDCGVDVAIAILREGLQIAAEKVRERGPR